MENTTMINPHESQYAGFLAGCGGVWAVIHLTQWVHGDNSRENVCGYGEEVGSRMPLKGFEVTPSNGSSKYGHPA